MYIDDLQGITLRYIYDWTHHEGLTEILHSVNADFVCKKKKNKMICKTVIDNPGINTIKIYDDGIVAFSIDGKEVLVGKRAIIPLKNGKLKIITKVCSKPAQT